MKEMGTRASRARKRAKKRHEALRSYQSTYTHSETQAGKEFQPRFMQ